jgi:hypothetical protein
MWVSWFFAGTIVCSYRWQVRPEGVVPTGWTVAKEPSVREEPSSRRTLDLGGLGGDLKWTGVDAGKAAGRPALVVRRQRCGTIH